MEDKINFSYLRELHLVSLLSGVVVDGVRGPGRMLGVGSPAEDSWFLRTGRRLAWLTCSTPGRAHTESGQDTRCTGGSMRSVLVVLHSVTLSWTIQILGNYL